MGIVHKRWIQFWFAAAAVLVVPLGALAFDPLNGDYAKDDPRDIRVVTYNHHGDFIENPSRDAAFNRILTALNPDIICFQEFSDNVSENDVANRLNSVLPIDGGGSWQIHFGLLGGIRTVIASRFLLTLTRTDTIPASSTRGVTIALVDLPDADYPVDVYLLGVHLKCCGDAGGTEDASRQDSADAIANWLGDARGVVRASGNNVVLPPDTPMINLGDFNLVGGPQPEATLISGDIQDEGTYGADVKGDWDVSDMADLHPTDPFTGDDFTWQGNQSFPPGRLDRIFLSDSVVTVANSFILNTDTMSPAALAGAGLQAGDTLPQNSSDHLPVAVDLRLASPACTVDGDCDDGLFCNGAETCDGSSVCQPGAAPCAGQMCREGDDTCVNCLDDGDCDDGVFCNGAEICDSNGECQAGGELCPGQLCRESDDVCVDCLDDSVCDDGNPCNGSEFCDAAGACQAGSCDTQANVVDESFGADAGAFVYQDDTFGTSIPGMANGTYEPAGGFAGGGIRVILGPGSTGGPTSGGWSREFSLDAAGTVSVSLRFRMRMGEGFESNEIGEAILRIDAVQFGNGMNSSLVHRTGNGNGGPVDDTGWLIEEFEAALAAGMHTITVGAFNNSATANDEWVETFFDEVTIVATVAGSCECDDGLWCNGAETCVAETCQAGAAPCEADAWCDEAADACVALGSGDFDGDQDVDLADYREFLGCFGQAGVGMCAAGNMVGADAMIDSEDLEAFAGAMTGPQ